MRRFVDFVIISIAASVSGCGSQYWTRSDSINISQGDAVRSNLAAQVSDPWPKGSHNTNIPMDPVKASNSVECYRLGAHANDPLGAEQNSYNDQKSGGNGGGGSGSNQNCSTGNGGAKDTFREGDNRRRANMGDAESVNAASTPRNPIVNPTTGEVLTPAGPNYVGTRDGTLYVPTGPGAPLLNTRSGLPTNIPGN